MEWQLQTVTDQVKNVSCIAVDKHGKIYASVNTSYLSLNQTIKLIEVQSTTTVTDICAKTEQGRHLRNASALCLTSKHLYIAHIDPSSLFKIHEGVAKRLSMKVTFPQSMVVAEGEIDDTLYIMDTHDAFSSQKMIYKFCGNSRSILSEFQLSALNPSMVLANTKPILFIGGGTTLLEIDCESGKKSFISIPFHPYKNICSIATDHNDTHLFLSDISQRKIFRLDLTTLEVVLIVGGNTTHRLYHPKRTLMHRGDVLYIVDGNHIMKLIPPSMPWEIKRLLWIAQIKNDPIECPLASIGKDAIVEIMKMYAAIADRKLKRKRE